MDIQTVKISSKVINSNEFIQQLDPYGFEGQFNLTEYLKRFFGEYSGNGTYKTTSIASVTGVTTQTILQSILIPAGTIKQDDILTIRARFSKTSSLGGWTPSVYINSALSVSGAQEIFQSAQGATIRYAQIKRQVVVRALTGASNEILNSSLATGITDDIVVATGTPTQLRTIDWTVDNYLFTTGQLVNSAEAINSLYLYLEKI